MEEKAEGTVTLKKSTLWKISTFVFAGLFVISLFTGGFGIGGSNSDTGSDTGGRAVAPTPSAPSPNRPTGVASVSAEELIDDDPVLGDPDAPVTMVEFSDFQCPFCGRFRSQTFDQIKKDYIDTGKVKFVYRDFPLHSIHPQAGKSAEAAQCANDQEKFWEYHDKIFENQQSLSIDNYKKWADDLGLNTKKFNDCLDSGKYKDEVEKDLADATKAGGQGTPYFVIGNTPVSGAQPYSNFQSVIEAEL
ncbi:MAG: DsbA family protein [Nanoarchaeota archaeon]